MKTIICQDRLGTHTRTHKPNDFIQNPVVCFVAGADTVCEPFPFNGRRRAAACHHRNTCQGRQWRHFERHERHRKRQRSRQGERFSLYIYCPWPGPVSAKYRFSLFLVSSLSWGPSLVYDEKLETEALVCVFCRRVMQRSWCWGPTFRPHTRSATMKTQRHAFFLIKSTVICQDRLGTKQMGN